MLDKASICSVTRIVPNSAAIALPTRPATSWRQHGAEFPGQRHVDHGTQTRFHLQLLELEERLYRQDHTDEHSRQGNPPQQLRTPT